MNDGVRGVTFPSMATLTNKHALPGALVRYLERDPYSRGDGVRYSVTQLIDEPRIRALRERHDAEISRDVSEMVWLILGKAVHKFLEDAAAERGDPDHTIEERCYLPVRNVVISGQMDVQDAGDGKVEIIDWKVTSAFAVMFGKAAWEQQLNCYAHLLRETKGKKVGKLSIVALLRDWSRRDAEKNPDYPQQPIVTIPIPVWPPAEAQEYVEGRVKLHLDADVSSAWGDDLQPCTDEGRWLREGMWIVERKAKPTKEKPEERWYTLRAVPTEAEARKIMADAKGEVRLTRRRSPPVRCAGNYCGVAEFCDQWKAERPAEQEA
ncbi:CRISPR-associated exonuclease, Cas4 family [Planktothrix phage Pag-Yong1]|nr:CRISPR-associated exonuclease, Cas4 family [Planktothrix phage Pag-Yong1]